MTKVQAIEEQIRQLSPEELAELRDWLAERDWSEWDGQIERDSASGKLYQLFARARAGHPPRCSAGVAGTRSLAPGVSRGKTSPKSTSPAYAGDRNC